MVFIQFYEIPDFKDIISKAFEVAVKINQCETWHRVFKGAKRIVKLWIFAHIQFLEKFQSTFGQKATPRNFLWISRTQIGKSCIEQLFQQVVELANDQFRYREYIKNIVKDLKQKKIKVTVKFLTLLILSVISHYP